MANQAEAYYAFLDRNGAVLESGPDPAHRDPQPIRGVDRPRRRLLVSGLRSSPGMVRKTSHHSLDWAAKRM